MGRRSRWTFSSHVKHFSFVFHIQGLRHADGPYKDPSDLFAERDDRNKFIDPERTWRT
jgi:hypothetical protein